MDTNKYYVYLYMREDMNTPYYVGKGQGNRITSSHRNGKVRVPPRERRIKIKENMSESDSFLLEKTLIKFWGRKDNGTGILHNMSDGGEGDSGREVWNKGKKCPQLSVSLKGNTNGKHQSEETRIKKRNRLLGNNRTGKPVRCLTPDGIIIEFKCVKDVADYFEVTPKVITKRIKQNKVQSQRHLKSKSSELFGYKFEYVL